MYPPPIHPPSQNPSSSTNSSAYDPTGHSPVTLGSSREPFASQQHRPSDLDRNITTSGNTSNSGSTIDYSTAMQSTHADNDLSYLRSRSGAEDRVQVEASTEVGEDGLTWVFTPPILVQNGMFRGRWLRFALAVAQEPFLGRRKTEKDRRPLGPAPIVRFKAVECRRRQSGNGDWNEEEVDPSSIEPSHLICAAELASPENSPDLAVSNSLPKATSSLHPESSEQIRAPGDVKSSVNALTGAPEDEVRDVPMIEQGQKLEFMKPSRGFDGLVYGATPTTALSSARSTETPFTPRQRGPHSEAEYQQHSSRGGNQYIPLATVRADGSGRSSQVDIASHDTASAYPQGAQRTVPVRNLYGSLHVAGVKVPAPEGGMGTWFLFTDLSVRQEGTYSLRFRCFDLTSVGPSVELPAPYLVECQSQPFRVYSPRQVPPLPKPTELAEHFAKQGFKLNTRKNERTVTTLPPSSTSLATSSSNVLAGTLPNRVGPASSSGSQGEHKSTLTTKLPLFNSGLRSGSGSGSGSGSNGGIPLGHVNANDIARDGNSNPIIKRPRIAPVQKDGAQVGGSSTSGGASTDSEQITGSGASSALED